MPIPKKLAEIRQIAGRRISDGLSNSVIKKFVATDETLTAAIDSAHQAYTRLLRRHPQLLALDEREQIEALQRGIVNFYSEDALNPYVALAANGPWIITSKGAVIHDNGGYGMLGFGHGPTDLLQMIGTQQVMANVMTASFSQYQMVRALQKELGHTLGHCPYSGFLFLNSGSEAVSMAARISDINAKLATDMGGTHAGRPIRHVALKGGFHGRTDRPAQYSDSSRHTYQHHLASFRDRDDLLAVEPNNLQQLQQTFDRAEAEGLHIESMFMEPVMGEGNPGLAISRAFYDLARALTRQHGSLLLVDSIQAGLRAHGCLSIVDYPGFEGIEPPDMESWSKALNGGQFPISVLGMTEDTERLYQKGLYGNTMTANPRALDVAARVLAMIDPKLRENIQQRGQEFKQRLLQLADELSGLITRVQGTGLLLSCELHPDFKSYGKDSIEILMRQLGVGVIHGGRNALRFTPHFNITSAEIDLIVQVLKTALLTRLEANQSDAA